MSTDDLWAELQADDARRNALLKSHAKGTPSSSLSSLSKVVRTTNTSPLSSSSSSLSSRSATVKTVDSLTSFSPVPSRTEPSTTPSTSTQRPFTIDTILSGSIRSSSSSSPSSSTVKSLSSSSSSTVSRQQHIQSLLASTHYSKSIEHELGLPSTVPSSSSSSSVLSSSSTDGGEGLHRTVVRTVPSVQQPHQEIQQSSKDLTHSLPPLYTFTDIDTLRAALARDINALGDDNPVVRRVSLQRLAVCLFDRDLIEGDDTAAIITLGATTYLNRFKRAADSSVSSSSSTSSVPLPSSVATTTAELTANLLNTPSQFSSVTNTTLLPSNIQQTELTLDPAYVYHAHELSEVAALLVGKSTDGTKIKRKNIQNLPSLHDPSSTGTGTTLSTGATSVSTILANTMSATPLLPLPSTATSSSSSLDFSSPSSTPPTDHRRTLLLQLWPELQKPLLKRFNDPHEPCRLQAFAIVSAFLSVIRDLSTVIPYLLPALIDRASGTWVYDPNTKIFAKNVEAAEAYQRGRLIATTQGVLASDEREVNVTRVTEPSDIGRMLLTRVTFSLLSTAVREDIVDMLEPYLHELIMIAHALAVDPSPDTRIIAAPLLLLLCDTVPYAMKFYAVGIIRSLMSGGIDHRHAKVRLATLDAIDALVMMEDEAKGKGAGTEAIIHLLGGRDANVVPIAAFYTHDTSVNYFAKLSIDSSPAVRLRFIHALGTWMTKLGDRLDWWPRLLPYLLSAYGDECEPVAKAAMEYVDACGVAHETEHGKLILERKQYGADGDPDVDYEGKPLPYPFPKEGHRPRLGTRLFVRAHCPRFIKPILSELGDWTPFGIRGGIDVRARAAMLLCTVLVYMEEYATADVHGLVHTCVSCIHDRDIGIYIRTAVRLMGRFLPPHAWLDVLVPIMKGEVTLQNGVHSVQEFQSVQEMVTTNFRKNNSTVPVINTAPTITSFSPEQTTDIDVMAACLHVLWLAAAECRSSRILPVIPRMIDTLTSSRILQQSMVLFPYDPQLGSIGYSRKVGYVLDRIQQSNRKDTPTLNNHDDPYVWYQDEQPENDDGMYHTTGDNNDKAVSTYTSLAIAAKEKLRKSGMLEGKGFSDTITASSTNSSNHHPFLTDYTTLTHAAAATMISPSNTGQEVSIARYSAREHILTCYALVTIMLENNVQTNYATGAENNGKLGQAKELVTKVLTSLLTIRGMMINDVIEGKSKAWSLENGRFVRYVRKVRKGNSANLLLPLFRYKDILAFQPVYETHGYCVHGSTGSSDTNELITLYHGDILDLVLHQLSKVDDTISREPGSSGSSNSTIDPLTLFPCVSGVSLTDDTLIHSSPYPIPDYPVTVLSSFESRYISMVETCLGDYPMDIGWKRIHPAHSALTALMHIPVSFVYRHPSMMVTCLNYFFDMGRNILDLTTQFPSSVATSTTTAVSDDTVGHTNYRRGRYGFYPLRYSVHKWMNLLIDYTTIVIVPLLGLHDPPVSAPFTATLPSLLSLLTQDNLQSIVMDFLPIILSPGLTVSNDKGTVSVSTDLVKSYGYFRSYAQYPDLFVTGCEIVRCLSPVLHRIYTSVTNTKTWTVTPLPSSYRTVTYVSSLVILQKLNECVNDWTNHHITHFVRARAIYAIQALLPMVMLPSYDVSTDSAIKDTLMPLTYKVLNALDTLGIERITDSSIMVRSAIITLLQQLGEYRRITMNNVSTKCTTNLTNVEIIQRLIGTLPTLETYKDMGSVQDTSGFAFAGGDISTTDEGTETEGVSLDSLQPDKDGRIRVGLPLSNEGLVFDSSSSLPTVVSPPSLSDRLLAVLMVWCSTDTTNLGPIQTFLRTLKVSSMDHLSPLSTAIVDALDEHVTFLSLLAK